MAGGPSDSHRKHKGQGRQEHEERDNFRWKSVFVCSLFVLTLVAAAVFLSAAQQAKSDSLSTCTLNVTGMTCAGCEAAVRNAAKSVDGVKDVKASYDKKNAEVTYDPTKTTPVAIAKVITERSGFKATPQPDKKK